MKLLHENKGAQVLNAALGSDIEMFYLSPLVALYPDNPIRGGIPLMFPQFGESGPLSKHGFVRDLRWILVDESEDDVSKNFSYVLDIKSTDFPAWPFDASLQLNASMGLESFTIELSVMNSGNKDFSFTGGFHPYFTISSRKDIQVNGLEALPFRDSFPGENAYVLNGDGLVERQYKGDAVIQFYNGSHWLKLASSGFDSWMIWNPGRVGATRISDLPDEDWGKFICIEPIVLDRPICLNPGQTFNGELKISIA